jgi:RTX calcium-binding nonapeptide repeat (4 copies)
MTTLGTATGTINAAGEHDWFKLNLNANTLYSLTSTDGHVFVMHDANGVLVPALDAFGGYATGDSSTNGIAFMPVTSGVYFVDISLPAGLGGYNIRLADVADDYRSNVTTSGTVAVGGAVAGTLDAPGDHDWIKVGLNANTLYAITATGDTFTQIRMLDANGAVLPLLDTFGGFGFGLSEGVGIGFMPVTGGDYYIDVSSFGAVGGYSISVAAAADDYRNNTSTTGAVAVGATVTGTINVTGEHDWFKVNLQANTLYAVSASSEAISTLSVMDANGQLVTALDAFGSTGFQGTGANGIGFMPKVGGSYFIDIGSAFGAGGYSLSVAASPDDYRNNTTTTGTVAVGGTVAGTFNTAGDHDWLRMNLTANTLYAITSPNSMANRLTMFDANGQEVEGSDGYGAAYLGFMPTTSGTYYLDVSSSAVPAGYSVAVAVSPDDYRSNVSTSGTVAANGSIAGVMNVLGDHDWIRVNLTANTLYAITTSGVAGSSMNMRDASGAEIGAQDAYGADTLGFMPASSGVYYIDLASSGATGNYTLNVAAVADDHRNNISTAGSVANTPGGAAGTAGNDILSGTAGNDVIDGLAGTDTVLYSGNRSSYAVSKTGSGYSLADRSGRDGTDTLQNIERIKFADLSIALDVGITQAAGKAQLLLGAVLGSALVAQKKPLIGAVIDLFDQGFTLQQLSGAVLRLDIWGVLANGGNATATNTQIANYLLTTVNKSAPSAATLAAAVAALDTEIGAAQGNFLAQLAESAANQVQVGLVGLATTGLEFGP